MTYTPYNRTDIHLVQQIVGRRIRHIRKSIGLRQRELAAKTGVTRTHIANLESGKFNFTLERLVEIADALQCDLRDLLPKIR